MDAALVQDLKDFRVEATWLNGEKVAASGQSLSSPSPAAIINRFHARPLHPDQLKIAVSTANIRVIEALDGELITRERIEKPHLIDGLAEPDPKRDLLMLSVVNRYQAAEPALGFIRGFGLQSGAIASSVAHDSHNILAVGADRESLCKAINRVIEEQGGIAVANDQGIHSLPLPIAGLMSNEDGDQVAKRYSQLNQLTKELGSSLRAPLMTLSFMALLVIPEIKLSDRGLFDGRTFQFTQLSMDSNLVEYFEE
jgi:adenine deaminase